MKIYGEEFKTPVFFGTAGYESLSCIEEMILGSGVEMITVSLRRSHLEKTPDKGRFWQILKKTGVKILPNTAGSMSAQEAIQTALAARDCFETDSIKLEVIADLYTLRPNPYELVVAAEELSKRGFQVWPYTTEDTVVGQRLVEAGCQVLMPWAGAIGSGQGPQNKWALKVYRNHFDLPLIIDAGIGRPSHVTELGELGLDGILANTALAQADQPLAMAKAFMLAFQAGQMGRGAGLMPMRSLAQPSTSLLGIPRWKSC